MSENAAYPAGHASEWASPYLDRIGQVLADRQLLPWALFLGVTGLALALNTWSLADSGWGNTYYAAAARSMSMSWKNFFFGAFDPGGFITVDKPPAFLWVGAFSARVFGYSSWSILLPSAIAGTASVALLWLIIRRWFGLAAATIAALVLALSPISVATSRLNLPEPFLILLLVAAAGCVLRSIESKRWWAWTAGAGLLVGLAFNTKMLAAWIPGPAFALAIVVAARTISKDAAKQTLMRLAVLGIVTLIVSGSWIAIVDAWPASDRPYVGGSTDNTELNLVLGYNGFGRVDGESQAPGNGGSPRLNQFQPPAPGGNPSGRGGQPPFGGGRFPGGGPFAGGTPPRGNGGPLNNGFRAAGGIIAGVPGLFRMFDSANGGQIAWLLPFALGGAVLALWHWRNDPVRRAFAVLFLGWVLLFGGIFSYAQGIYHSYYTAALAPGIAALAGIGGAALLNEIRRDRRWLIIAAALVGVTVLVQLHIAGRTPEFYGWVRPYTVIAAVAGVALLALLAAARKPLAAGLALSVGAMLLLPGAWTVSAVANSSLNTTLPQAGPREGASGQSFGSEAFDSGVAQLAGWLQAHNDPGATWQIAVRSAQNGSTLIAEYGISVLPIGGFSGRDDTLTVGQFADLVASGQVRYVEASGRTGGPAGNRGSPASDDSAAGQIMSAVEQACTPVSGSGLPDTYAVYDCAGAADALRAAG